MRTLIDSLRASDDDFEFCILLMMGKFFFRSRLRFEIHLGGNPLVEVGSVLLSIIHFPAEMREEGGEGGVVSQ